MLAEFLHVFGGYFLTVPNPLLSIVCRVFEPLVIELKEFFKQITDGRKITFDSYTVSRFLTYARILDPASKFAT
mgnify:CR=1 FL=1